VAFDRLKDKGGARAACLSAICLCPTLRIWPMSCFNSTTAPDVNSSPLGVEGAAAAVDEADYAEAGRRGGSLPLVLVLVLGLVLQEGVNSGAVTQGKVGSHPQTQSTAYSTLQRQDKCMAAFVLGPPFLSFGKN